MPLDGMHTTIPFDTSHTTTSRPDTDLSSLCEAFAPFIALFSKIVATREI